MLPIERLPLLSKGKEKIPLHASSCTASNGTNPPNSSLDLPLVALTSLSSIPTASISWLVDQGPTDQQARSIHSGQELRLQDELALLVLLRSLVRLVILPPHRLFALSAVDIPYEVPPRRHVALHGFCLGDVYDGGEEVGFAVLAAEGLVEGEQRVSWK